MGLLLAFLLLAPQDEKKTIDWKDLKAGPLEGGKPGTRIKATLRNGNTLRGTVLHPDFLREVNPKDWRPKPYDFTKTEFVLLDIALEQPKLGGHVRLKKSDLRLPLVELNPVDGAMLERLRKERERIKAENEKALEEFELRKQEREAEDEATRKKAEEEERALAEIDAIDKKKKDLERLQEAIRFYDRFPEGSVEDQQAGKAWGSERLKLIQMKQNGRLILSPEEIEFLSNLDLWAMGKRYREEEKKKEEGEKP